MLGHGCHIWPCPAKEVLPTWSESGSVADESDWSDMEGQRAIAIDICAPTAKEALRQICWRAISVAGVPPELRSKQEMDKLLEETEDAFTHAIRNMKGHGVSWEYLATIMDNEEERKGIYLQWLQVARLRIEGLLTVVHQQRGASTCLGEASAASSSASASPTRKRLTSLH